MAFFNAVLRDYSPDSGKSDVLCRVWICSLSDFKKIPKSWFFSFNGKLVKKSEVDKRMMAKFTLLTPLHIYCRPRRSKDYPILINLEFFNGGSESSSLEGLTGITVDVKEEDSVEVLKNKIEKGSGIPGLQQRLIYAGAQLKDKKLIKDYGIRMEEVVYVVDGVRKGIGGGGREDESGRGLLGLEEEEDGGGAGEEDKKEVGSCVVCDKRRRGMEEFVVDCGHFYHACCLPPVKSGDEDGRGCAVCDVELLGWSEALELFAEEDDILRKEGDGGEGGGDSDGVKKRTMLLQAPELLTNEEDVDEGIEVDFTAMDALKYSEEGTLMERLTKWKEYDEFYFLIAAILIPMIVGSTLGSFWGALAALGMIEVLRRRSQGNNEEINEE